MGRTISLRFSVFYAAYFLQVGIALPFWPVALSLRGLGPGQIGLVMAAQAASRVIVGPLIGFAADRYRLGRGWLAAVAGLASLGLAAFGLVHGFLPILLLSVTVAPLYSSILPLVDAHALGQAESRGLDYGRMRLWGSLGFVASNLAAGALIAGAGPGLILGLVAGAALMGALAAPLLPPIKAAAHLDAARPDWRHAGRLLRSPPFLAVTLIAGCIQASHALLYGFGTLGWRARGIGDGAIGLLWAVGVLAEVALLSQSRRLERAIGAEGLLVLGGAACVLRWGAMMFAPSLPLLFALQLLHAFTFAATYVAAIHLVQRAAPPGLVATAQALYAGIASGILFGAASGGSGLLFARYGAEAYAAPGLLGAVCTGAAILMLRARGKASEPLVLSPTMPGPAET